MWGFCWFVEQEIGRAGSEDQPLVLVSTTSRDNKTDVWRRKKPPTDASEPEVKKSSTGICHEKGTTYYGRMTNYTAYDSLDACLASGGRLPSR